MAEQRYFDDKRIEETMEKFKHPFGRLNDFQTEQVKKILNEFAEIVVHQTGKATWKDLESGFVHGSNGSVSKQIVKDTLFNCKIP